MVKKMMYFFNWIKIICGFADRTFGSVRSSGWPAFRKSFLKKNPYCAVCGRKGTLLNPNEAHHKIPVSWDIEKKWELDYNNLITLCRKDHLSWGHYYNFSSFSPNIDEDIKIWRAKIKNRPTKMEEDRFQKDIKSMS